MGEEIYGRTQMSADSVNRFICGFERLPSIQEYSIIRQISIL